MRIYANTCSGLGHVPTFGWRCAPDDARAFAARLGLTVDWAAAQCLDPEDDDSPTEAPLVVTPGEAAALAVRLINCEAERVALLGERAQLMRERDTLRAAVHAERAAAQRWADSTDDGLPDEASRSPFAGARWER